HVAYLPSLPQPAEIKVRSRAILPGSGRPEHQTTGPLPQPSATIHPARDDLVVAFRRRTPVDRNAHDRDSVAFRRSFFNTHARFHQQSRSERNRLFSTSYQKRPPMRSGVTSHHLSSCRIGLNISSIVIGNLSW